VFSNTCNGANVSAVLYAFVETATVNGLDEHDYISNPFSLLLSK